MSTFLILFHFAWFLYFDQFIFFMIVCVNYFSLITCRRLFLTLILPHFLNFIASLKISLEIKIKQVSEKCYFVCFVYIKKGHLNTFIFNLFDLFYLESAKSRAWHACMLADLRPYVLVCLVCLLVCVLGVLARLHTYVFI